jgi:N-acetylneuraminic acid mutarotase
MIIWGGTDSENTGGRYDPATDTWDASGTSLVGAPTGRELHTAVWTGSVMIIWAGAQPALTNTGGRYDPSTDTWNSTSLTDVPSARSDHTAVWTGTQMIVWGGSTGGITTTNTGGLYNPATDTWTSGGTTTTGAPTARDEHTAVWTDTEMIIWGGGVNTGGRYDPGTNTWADTSLTNAPTARSEHSAIWSGSEMIVWGGTVSTNTGGRYDPATDTWAAGGTNISGAPHDRFLHTSVWTGTEMIVWGGHANAPATVTRQGGRYDPATNTWFPGGTSLTNVPLGRFMHTAVWTGTEMIVWGGSNEFNEFDTGGRYDPLTDSWSATTTTGVPAGRFFHTAIWTGTEMVVWGGEDPSLTNTGGRYDPATDSWDDTSLVNAPVARTNHTAVWTGTEMIVWGGAASPLPTDTGGRYDPATDTWDAGGTSLTDAPSARFRHTAVWTGTQMIIWGGSLTDTGGLYDPATDSWVATSTTDAPSARSFHTAVWTDTEMIIWGGDTDTGGRYDPSSDTWIATTTTDAPVARREHTAIWTGTQMIVWGGSDLDGLSLNTGGLYTVSTCSFSDDFEDNILDDQWTYIKPSWAETGGAIVGTPTKGKTAAIATPRFAGCLNSSVEAEMESAGGPGSTFSLFAWYVSKEDNIELVLNEKKNKITLKQRVGGDVVESESASVAINPNTVYEVQITFDGTQFEVFVDTVSLITMVPAAPVPVGTVGFQAKKAIGKFHSINVEEL